MKCYQTFIYLVLTNIKTLSIRRYLSIQLKLPKALKGHCFFDRWYHFTIIFLISLLHSHLFCKHDVVTLLAPCQHLQISIFFAIFIQCFTGFRREYTFVQYLTISVLSKVLRNVLISVILFKFYLQHDLYHVHVKSNLILALVLKLALLGQNIVLCLKVVKHRITFLQRSLIITLSTSVSPINDYVSWFL